jgi:hypothetical protein
MYISIATALVICEVVLIYTSLSLDCAVACGCLWNENWWKAKAESKLI